MVLLIDTREKNSELIDLLIQRCEQEGVEYKLTALDVGDFVWEECGICIEHKSTEDYIKSITTNHLQTQALDMEQYPHAYLFIEGNWTLGFSRKYGRFTYQQKIGSLVSLIVRTKLKVLECKTLHELVHAVFSVREKVEKGEKVEVVVRHSKTSNRLDPNLDMYLSLPGVGEKKAQQLVSTFPSFYSFLTYYKTSGYKLPKQTCEYLDKL